MEIYGRELAPAAQGATPHFTVDITAVKGTQEFITELLTRVDSGDVYVSAEDFPVWLAAIGATSFYTSETSSGQRFAHVSKFMSPGHTSYLCVNSREADQFPEWVTWPDGQGSRTHAFTAVAS